MHGDSQVVPSQQPPLLPVIPLDPSPIIPPTLSEQSRQPSPRPARKPGRPATYVFDKPDEQLTEKERKAKIAIEKRRLRQNRSYHRRKKFRKTLSDIKDNFHKHTRPDPATASLFSSTEQLHTSRTPTTTTTTANSPHDSLSNQAWSISNGSVAVPKFIAGFAQNPLDLLAPSPPPSEDIDHIPPRDPSQPPVSTEDVIRDATATAAAQTPDIKTDVQIIKNDVELDRVSPPPAPDFQESMQDVPPANSSNPAVDTALNLPPAASLDISSFSFGLEQPKGTEEEQQEATDVLVNSALVAAKEYANNPMNMKDPVQEQLIRNVGIRQIVFDNLRSLYLSMTPPVQDTVRHFAVFPSTFNLTAAIAIAGLDSSEQVAMQGMLDTLKHANFIKTKKGRYELSEMGRIFLDEDPSVLSYNLAANTFNVAQTRFINHYRSKLSELQNENIHKVGWVREQAMATYDTEKANMEFVECLLQDRKFELREFLSTGITVMRYCVSAAKRELVLRKALEEDETSTESILLGFGEENSALGSTSSHDMKSPGPCDKPYKARLQLALSEAYFDQLKIEAAEEPLVRALKLMGDAGPAVPRCSKPSSGIVDSVLVLLLLSNLRLAHKRFRDARLLCLKAIKILVEAGLGRSTFGINAMSNLATISLEEGHVSRAKSVFGKLLVTVKSLRFTGMPIYADTLGVCAQISMAEKKYAEAEEQYRRALETMAKWGTKEWIGIPVQHCLDLDLWLMEGMAKAIHAQGRAEEGAEVETRAAEVRQSRGLNVSGPVTDYLQMGENGQQMNSVASSRLTLRHLY